MTSRQADWQKKNRERVNSRIRHSTHGISGAPKSNRKPCEYCKGEKFVREQDWVAQKLKTYYGFVKPIVVDEINDFISKAEGKAVLAVRKKLAEEILPDLYRLRANIPLTHGIHAREMAVELIQELVKISKEEK